MFKKISTFSISTLVLLLLQPTATLAKGGSSRSEDRYNPQHITSLPPEVRQIVVSKCKEPRALHEFSNYRDGTTEIVLHYEHLICGLSNIYCSRNACLHEFYRRSAQGRYRLVRSFYVVQPDVENYW
jgi:hypothetical protein